MLKIPKGTDLHPIMVKTFDSSVYCYSVEFEPNDNPWNYNIKGFLKEGKYPELATPRDKITLRKLVCRFFLNGEILYKKSNDSIFLRCVGTSEAKKIMSEIHEDNVDLI